MADCESLALNAVIRRCDTCRLRAKKGLGIGNLQARVLLLAQNPGNPTPNNPTLVPFAFHRWGYEREEKSAAVLKQMLLAVRIPLDVIYITNAMKCRGPLRDKYVASCADWLEQELLALADLQVIVALGSVAAQRLHEARLFHLDWYTSVLDPARRWLMTSVYHPAAPLYPGGISLENYEAQWRFVAAVYRRVCQP